MSEEKVLVSREGAVCTITLNRPEAYNALDLETMEPFAQAMIAAGTDAEVRAIILTGAGKAFCAGGDLKWALEYNSDPAVSFRTLAGHLHLAVTEMRRTPKPVIAAVNGVAAGAGFSLALACDFRVLAQGVKLRQAYTSNGLCIDGGGTWILPRLVGAAKALEIAALDPVIEAQQAVAMGLATRVAEDALAGAQELATELTGISLNSYGWSKRLINDAYDTPLETHLEREREGLASCARHPDGHEGLKAFREKRKPTFG